MKLYEMNTQPTPNYLTNMLHAKPLETSKGMEKGKMVRTIRLINNGYRQLVNRLRRDTSMNKESK